MLYTLSKLIPVPMHTKYGLHEADGTISHWRATWVQWRGRIWRNRVTAI